MNVLPPKSKRIDVLAKALATATGCVWIEPDEPPCGRRYPAEDVRETYRAQAREIIAAADAQRAARLEGMRDACALLYNASQYEAADLLRVYIAGVVEQNKKRHG